ncbi:hypothetical protein ANCCAN_01385 [Ancylostoma caninum]|uniref:Uncharacterized protein n=1 Tax=Ancylostoma caninum TaxID=29170 RepID=A0A368H6U6_ANCCA|nr:hypothetical protein ANCCAN_01385 [Ancylostoma caninum]
MYLLHFQRAIKGIGSGVLFDNLWPKHTRAGDVLSKDPRDKSDRQRSTGYYVFADSTTSFMILIGVFFPSATGEFSLRYFMHHFSIVFAPFCSRYLVVNGKPSQDVILSMPHFMQMLSWNFQVFWTFFHSTHAQ